MAQNIIHSPWERIKGPWLWLMTSLVLFSLLWVSSFVSVFLTSLMKVAPWLKFSTGERQAEDVAGRAWCKDHRVLLCSTVEVPAGSQRLQFQLQLCCPSAPWPWAGPLPAPGCTVEALDHPPGIWAVRYLGGQPCLSAIFTRTVGSHILALESEPGGCKEAPRSGNSAPPESEAGLTYSAASLGPVWSHPSSPKW